MSHKSINIMYEGEFITSLNPVLLKAKGITDDGIDYLIKLHQDRVGLERAYEAGKINVDDYLKEWNELQFKLQEAWGFDLDASKHRFWDMAGCTCEKRLNVNIYNDHFPNTNKAQFIKSKDCPIHKHEAGNKN